MKIYIFYLNTCTFFVNSSLFFKQSSEMENIYVNRTIGLIGDRANFLKGVEQLTSLKMTSKINWKELSENLFEPISKF